MTNNECEAESTVSDPSFAPVPLEHQARVATLVHVKKSLDGVAKMLKVSPLTVSKIVGGQRVSRGTRALIAVTIAKRDAAGRNP